MWMTMFFLASQPTPCSFAQEISAARENQIKVSYIYNFTKFINWPDDETDKSRLDNFPICIMGGEPLISLLNHLSETKKIKNKTVTILKNPLLRELKTCKVLFIDSTNSDRLYSILANLKGLHVLTISDTEGYARRGVGVNMFEENNKIRFEINRKVLVDAGLTVSSELLKLGVSVVTEN
jgi:YfiR/HmsC-like